MPKQTLELRLRARLPMPRIDIFRIVKPRAFRENFDQKNPAGIGIVGIEIAQCVSGPKRLVVLGERDFE